MVRCHYSVDARYEALVTIIHKFIKLTKETSPWLWFLVATRNQLGTLLLWRTFCISRVHPSTLSTCPHRPHGMPRRYHVPLRRVMADLVQLEVRRIAFRNLTCIHLLYLSGLDITAVCEFLKLADSFPEIVNHDLLLTLELRGLLLLPSFPHPLLKSNLCRIDDNHMWRESRSRMELHWNFQGCKLRRDCLNLALTEVGINVAWRICTRNK